MGRLDRGISKARSTAVPIDPTEDGAGVRVISVIGILVIDDISLIASRSGASLGMKAAEIAPEYGVGSASAAILTGGASVDERVGVLAANGIGAASMTGTAPIAGAVGGGDGSVVPVGFLYTGGLYEKGYTWGIDPMFKTGLNSGWRSPLC